MGAATSAPPPNHIKTHQKDQHSKAQRCDGQDRLLHARPGPSPRVLPYAGSHSCNFTFCTTKLTVPQNGDNTGSSCEDEAMPAGNAGGYPEKHSDSVHNCLA